jgi:hypothetical protein
MSERRRAPRQLALKTGKIRALYLPSDIDCAIFNISSKGASILLPIGTRVPDTFQLTIDPGRDDYICRLAWKSGNKIGVSFQSRIAR